MDLLYLRPTLPPSYAPRHGLPVPQLLRARQRVASVWLASSHLATQSCSFPLMGMSQVARDVEAIKRTFIREKSFVPIVRRHQLAVHSEKRRSVVAPEWEGNYSDI
jgi:hypothetical protein